MNQQWIITAISVLLLAAIAGVARIIQNQRRSQTLWDGLSRSLPGPLRVRVENRRDGQFATFEPAPEPFRKLQAELQVTSRPPKLHLRGKLMQRVQGELLWTKGYPPARALRRTIDAGLWELRRIDLLDGEFAVRGGNTSALEHVFFDLQARFGPFIQKVSVQVDGEHEVEIELNASRLNSEDLPALVATIRALGRAALR